ncbi:MAG: hypothetical protein FJW36_22035 [Acidobacteria bacterium]|nr:hypothetical protein [Acidobacteriota bacterium]
MRFLLCAILALTSLAQDRNAIRPVPPPGIEISPTDRAELTSRLQSLQNAIRRIEPNPLLPDVIIYANAVRYALEHNEFFKPDEVQKAQRLLDSGLERARHLAEGRAPWTTATGLVVRGYISKIDQSVQPYGLVIPASFTPHTPHRWRLDAWFHGRNETLSEINFLFERESRAGEFTPPNAIVLHLYGRYCNASRFAGEIDFHEALAATRQHYAIDNNRILIRGFSMGGASAWDIGTHYAGDWAAVAPGAGFSETKAFLRLDLTKPDAPFPWEQQMWRMYDATEYAVNLANTATVAYNGDQDGQKQAADAMEEAMAKEGIALTRVTGPQTGHRYHPQSKIEIESKLNEIAAIGRIPYPNQLVFTTFTLAYNRMKWLTIDGLEQHWERARIEASIESPTSIKLTTTNTTAITLNFGPGSAPLRLNTKPTITIDNQPLTTHAPVSDRSWLVHLRKSNGQWAIVKSPIEPGLHKIPGLQGPIDHAFMDRFLMVKPTGMPSHLETANWAIAEMHRAQVEWRKQFRGEAQIKEDIAVSDADIASSNLILWGDPGSNKLLARILDKLPITWNEAGLKIGDRAFSRTHAPILIFPNPLNPSKYVVLNSSFTFREFDSLNNARQTPKLPDWAVVDTATGRTPRYPGIISAAGFFDENWGLSAGK